MLPRIRQRVSIDVGRRGGEGHGHVHRHHRRRHRETQLWCRIAGEIPEMDLDIHALGFGVRGRIHRQSR